MHFVVSRDLVRARVRARTCARTHAHLCARAASVDDPHEAVDVHTFALDFDRQVLLPGVMPVDLLRGITSEPFGRTNEGLREQHKLSIVPIV